METQGPAEAKASNDAKVSNDAKAPTGILIVDDEPPLLKMMSLYLRRLGYAVTTCDRTEQASALIPAAIGEFAVAVLDATMAGIPMEALARDMLRAHLGLREAARAAKLSPGYWCLLEHNERCPSESVAELLVRILRLTGPDAQTAGDSGSPPAILPPAAGRNCVAAVAAARRRRSRRRLRCLSR